MLKHYRPRFCSLPSIFLYIRKTLWCFVFVVLALACKEEIAGVVAMLGLWALLLQEAQACRCWGYWLWPLAGPV